MSGGFGIEGRQSIGLDDLIQGSASSSGGRPASDARMPVDSHVLEVVSLTVVGILGVTHDP